LVRYLQQQEYAEAAEQFHQPEYFDEGDSRRDREDVARSLAFLVPRFGIPSNVRRSEESEAIWKVGVAGVSGPYWESLPNWGRDEFVSYAVDFEREGPGYIQVNYFLGGGRPEVQSVDFILPSSREDAKQVVFETMKEMSHSVMPEVEFPFTIDDLPDYTPNQ
jgi:hypothetical protein